MISHLPNLIQVLSRQFVYQCRQRHCSHSMLIALAAIGILGRIIPEGPGSSRWTWLLNQGPMTLSSLLAAHDSVRPFLSLAFFQNLSQVRRLLLHLLGSSVLAISIDIWHGMERIPTLPSV